MGIYSAFSRYCLHQGAELTLGVVQDGGKDVYSSEVKDDQIYEAVDSWPLNKAENITS